MIFIFFINKWNVPSLLSSMHYHMRTLVLFIKKYLLHHSNWKICGSRKAMHQASFKSSNSLCSWNLSRGGVRAGKGDSYHIDMSITFNRRQLKVIAFSPSVPSSLVDRTHYCANEPARHFSHLPHQRSGRVDIS